MRTTILLLATIVVSSTGPAGPKSVWGQDEGERGITVEFAASASDRSGPMSPAEAALVEARKKVLADREILDARRKELSDTVKQLVDQIHEQRRLETEVREEAEAIRAKYLQLVSIPAPEMEHRGRSYTPDELVSQISVLLVQLEGIQATVKDLEQLRQTAEGKLEETAVRIHYLDSRVVMLDVWRDLVRVQSLPRDGERLIAQVDTMLAEVAAQMEGVQVVGVEELVPNNKHRVRPSMRNALAFIEAFPGQGESQPNQVLQDDGLKPTQESASIRFEGTFEAELVPQKDTRTGKPFFRQHD